MRSPEALKPRETHRTPNWPGAELSMETIRAYLADLSGRGRRKGTVQMYSAKLRALYDYLPPDKQISRGTLAAWRAFLLEAGYSPSTVNTHLSAANGLMEYMGRRDLQLVGQLEADKGLQPELSRVEYLRLLQAARILEKERTYLLVKIFALAGIRVGELPQVTVERVRAGRLPVRTGGERRYVPLPACLQGELLDYARRQGLTAGPVFCTRNGKGMSRTQVTEEIQTLCHDARVEEEKGTPRCLRKLCVATQESIRANLELLAEQTYDRLLEKESLTAGWSDCYKGGEELCTVEFLWRGRFNAWPGSRRRPDRGIMEGIEAP